MIFKQNLLVKLAFALALSLMLVSCGDEETTNNTSSSGGSSGGGSSDQQVQTTKYKTLFVCENKTGNSDGSSWDNCYSKNDINKAVKSLEKGGSLYFKVGNYELSQTIFLTQDVKLYGGFEGTENDISERKLGTKASVLSGKGQFLVINAQNLSKKSVLDSFVIKNGKTNSYGGAMFNKHSNIMIKNVSFMNNVSSYGGALANQDSNPTIINATFNQNNSSIGGAIFNRKSNPTIINTTFSQNAATGKGGAISNTASKPTIINATFSENTAASSSGVITSIDSQTKITNSIIWGNTPSAFDNKNSSQDISYSIVEGIDVNSEPYNNKQNISEDPQLTKANITELINGVEHVAYISTVAKDNGNNEANKENTDQLGGTRIKNNTIDIGAIEAELN